MKSNEIPKKIMSILEKVEKKQKPTTDEQEALRTFLGTLTTSMVNPANEAKELNNPFPMEVDVSLSRPESIEQRVRRIMSVSSKLAEASQMESAEEADDFQVDDNFDVMPNSPFEMVDHFAPMQPEQPVGDPPDPAGSSVTDTTTPSGGDAAKPTAPEGVAPEPVVKTE